MKERYRKGRTVKARKVTSLMVVPHNSDQVVTWQVSNIRLKIVSLLALLIITAASLSAYITIVLHENNQLKRQQKELSAFFIEHQKTIEDNISEIAQAEDLDTLTKEKIDEFSYLLQNVTTNYIEKEMKTLTVSRSSIKSSAATAFIEKISELRALISFLEDNEKQGDEVFSVLTDKKEELQNYLDHLPTYWPTKGKIKSEFGNRFHPVYKKFTDHTGVDIGGTKGNSIYAAASGKVVFAGKSSGYGNYVDIDHGNGLVTRYAHCRKLLVKKGQTVKIGEKIALVGDTGTSTGPHLHFEVRIKDTAVDPSLFIGTKP
ncbi:MAG: peptidoglycan DD-metalloendopeptidase family protein [Thermoclostridium sp.]|nr:peptidoglycan DD-metalloendopeptidase family protein [Thermoclostridium sp.]